ATERRSEEKQKNRKRIHWSWSSVSVLVSATTFCLGCWQVRRLKWKENLISDLHNRLKQKAIDFPEDKSELCLKLFVETSCQNTSFFRKKILVNRGWISDSQLDPKDRLKSNMNGELVFEGRVAPTEKVLDFIYSS
ncbi:unnamed protein product, partial [Enterobius vermicularis]|uniref:SURF1-like protein n=1 Tax=Enterobius vermicularis TaxID=51028 RepID=A0A0N4VDN6_ENTVE